MNVENTPSYHELMDKKILVLGYGSQGRAQAMNLRDRGLEVEVFVRKGKSWDQAISEGWSPVELSYAEDADLICFLVPDMAQPEICKQLLQSPLKPGCTFLFSHGFNVHYQMMDIPKDVNVAMVAPKGPGLLVRREFEQGGGVPCLVAVNQDESGEGKTTAMAYADAIGGGRSGIIETTFKEETETDLFGEQAVLCGGVSELVVAGWETLVEAGYKPQVAYFECLHELKLIVDLLYEGGLTKMLNFVSDTAKYGDLSRGSRIITKETRENMRAVLKEIQNGQFANEWRNEWESGGENYAKMLNDDKNHPIESVGKEIRAKFRWDTKPKEKETAK